MEARRIGLIGVELGHGGQHDLTDLSSGFVGIDHVAIGSDYDGIEKVPVGLEDVAKLPNLTAALLRRGYSITDVRKLLGENYLRVFRQVCK